MTQEPVGQLGRAAAIGALLAALFGLAVWAGASPVIPTENEVPNEVEVTSDREAYVGERVALGGFVVDTDPVVLATWASGDGRFTLVDADAHVQNSNEPIETGDHISAYGTLEDKSTLDVQRVTTQQPSETRYMLLVSLVGGLWVAGRAVRGWRFDLDRLAFVPRDRTRSLDDGSSDRERSDPDSTADARARDESAPATRDGHARSSRGERRA